MIADPDGSAASPPPPRPSSRELAVAAMKELQMELLSCTLQRYIEDLEGHPPSDETLDRESMHCCFSSTPLTRFSRNGHEFTTYFVWRGAHALAHGFLDPKMPNALMICRLKREEWPAALNAYVSQHYGQ